MKKSEAIDVLLTVAARGRGSVARGVLAAAVLTLKAPVKKSGIDPTDARRAAEKAAAIKAKTDAERAAAIEAGEVFDEVDVFEPEIVTTVTTDE